MKKITGVLFDFDGVLIDSLPVMEKAWFSIQENYAVYPGFEKYKQHIGIPFRSILRKLEIDSNLHQSIENHYSRIASENKDLITLNPYVRKLLRWLKDKSIPTGIVTSKDKCRTLELIEFFQLDVKAVVTPELTPRGKPYPEPIQYAAKELSLEINKIVFVGDMFSDMQCAMKANCYYLHYLNGYQIVSENIYGGVINSLTEVIEYITYF